MQANELRIGNLVRYCPDDRDEILEVGGIYKEREIWYLNGIYLNDNIFAPILLTEEWLERLGFEKCYSNSLGKSFDRYDCIWNPSTGVSIQYEEQMFIPVNCKYVHQLQNLYFSLTNKELEIKEYAS